MKSKKEKPQRGTTDGEQSSDSTPRVGSIASRGELKQFLQTLRDRVGDGQASPIHVMTALNHVMHTPELCPLLDDESKEIARDLWLRLKQSGLQMHTPPLLFSDGGGSR